MTWRAKTLIWVGTLLLALLIALYLVASFIVLREFEAIEINETREDVERVLDALAHYLEKMAYTARDWAEWDDSYEFIENYSEQFIQTNLSDQTIARLGFNLVLYVHASGRLVFGTGFDLEAHQRTPIPLTIQEPLRPGDPLLEPARTGRSRTGIILLPEGPLMIAAHPILPSRGQGPIRGTLIFGRYFSRAVSDQLAEQTHLAFTVHPYNEADLTPDLAAAYAALSEQSPVFVRRPSDEVIAGYALIRSLYGSPALLLRVENARHIYQQGVASMRTMLLWLLAIGLVAGAITLWLTSRTLLSRLYRLSSDLVRIGTSGDLSQRMSVTGQDELAQLSGAINQTLMALRTSQEKERETEARYRTLFDDIPLGLYRTSPDGQFHDVNLALVQILGYPDRASLLAAQVAEIYARPEQRQQVTATSARAGGSRDLELQLRRYDGQVIWAKINSHAVYDENGKVKFYEGALEDITQRRQIAETLKTQARVLESMVEGVNVSDENGLIVFTNPAFDAMFGYERGELIGQHVSVLNRYPPTENARTIREITEQLKTRGWWTGEFDNRRKDGTPFTTSARINALEISGRLHFVSVQEDITERQRMLEALKTSEASFRLLFAHNPHPMWVYDLETLQFLEVNEAALAKYGYTRNEFLQMRITDLRPAEDLSPLAASLKPDRPALQYSGQWRHRLKNGRIIDVDITSHTLEFAGRPAALVLAQDITDRKRAEEALKKAEAEYRSIFGNVPIGLYRTTPDGQILAANPALVRMLGYPDRDALQRVNVIDLYVHPQERARDKAVMAQKEGSHEFEMQLRRRDGRTIWVKDTARAITDAQGPVVYFEGALEEITERKKSERERELLLTISRRVNEAATIGELTQNSLTDICEILEAPSAQIYLYYPEKQELMSVAHRGLTPEILTRTVRQSVGLGEAGVASRTAATRQLIIVEDMHTSPLLQHLRQATLDSTLQSLISIPLLAEGELQGVLQVATADQRRFTERDQKLLEQVAHVLALGISRKRAEAALAASEAEYRDLVENANDGIFTLDRRGRFTSFNRKAEEITGYTRQEILGQPYSQIVPPAERRKAIQSFLRNLRGAANTVELTIRRPDGQEVVLELSTRPLYQADQIVGTQGIVRDITERKELEKLKAEFISMVSHDMRTPLTSIKGYTELILAGEVGPLNPEQKEFLEIIARNTTRLTELINDLLDLERLESGRVQLDRKPLDLADVLGDVMKTFRVNAAEKRLDFHRELEPGLVIQGDPERLIQVFANLISNAIKYTQQGAVRVRAFAHRKKAVIEVRDSGIGISPEDAKRLFEKFFRSQHPYVRQVGGTGLGLVLAKVIVEQHGGTIGVASELGQGSTFTVRLPLLSEGRRARPAPQAGPPSMPPLVLIVDDEEDIARLIQTYLEKMGCRTAVAHTGQDGLAKAKALRPDLITLDVMMPDMDGFETLSRLKQDPQTRAVPVVFLSIVPDGERGLRLGASAYLHKPIHEERLRATIKRFLHRRAQPILVVDDDPDFCQLIERCLTRAGYRVEAVHDGEEALDKIRREKYQLILLDKNLPRQSGLEVLMRLRADPSVSGVPVIMVSGSESARELEEEIHVLGAQQFLTKRLDPQEIVAAILRTLPPESPNGNT